MHNYVCKQKCQPLIKKHIAITNYSTFHMTEVCFLVCSLGSQRQLDLRLEMSQRCEVRGQFSEESVSSVEPSLSISIFLLWWMFLLGEALLCASLSPTTALPLLLLPGLTDIKAILDSTGQGRKQNI